jgi:hypothetical protein
MVENHLYRLARDAQTSQLSSHRVPHSMKVGILPADVAPT